MQNKTKIMFISITIFLIVIVIVTVNNNIKFNESLNYFKNEAFIDYILNNNIEKNRNINKICDVILESYKENDEVYMKKLGKNIHSNTFDAYLGEYKLTKGMKNLSECVINSDIVKNMSLEDKIRVTDLLHAEVNDFDDYDFGFIKFTKEEIDNYIKENQIEVITEYNKGGYYDSKCPQDSKKTISIPEKRGYFTYYSQFNEVYEYNCDGDFMEIKYTYLEDNREISPIKDEREKSYVRILYKGFLIHHVDSIHILVSYNLEDVKNFIYTDKYAFEYRKNNIYIYTLSDKEPRTILIYSE